MSRRHIIGFFILLVLFFAYGTYRAYIFDSWAFYPLLIMTSIFFFAWIGDLLSLFKKSKGYEDYAKGDWGDEELKVEKEEESTS